MRQSMRERDGGEFQGRLGREEEEQGDRVKRLWIVGSCEDLRGKRGW